MRKKINVQWERVRGPDLDPGKGKRAAKNKATLEDKIFLEVCKRLNIEPTKRQASKWNSKKGKAFKGKGL